MESSLDRIPENPASELMIEATMNPRGAGKGVLIVEDHPLVAEATSLFLSKIDASLHMVVCGCADDAIAEFQRSNAWFRIFLDLDVPGAHGLSIVRQFVRLGVGDRCVVVTGTENSQWQAESAAMGVLGYVHKATSIAELTCSLEAAIKGDRVFSSEVPAMPNTATTRLTRRQQDVLCLLHRGYTSKEIARQLALNTGTVDNHVSGILRALNVSNRTHAIAKAIELGFIRVQDAPSRKSEGRDTSRGRYVFDPGLQNSAML